MTGRSLCPECNANRGVQEFPDGKYCHACHQQLSKKSLIKRVSQHEEQKTLALPERDSMTKSKETGELFNLWPAEAFWYLKKYYITEEDIQQCNLFWSEKYQRICFPYYSRYGLNDQDGQKSYMLFCWMRSVNKEVRNKWVFVGQKNVEMYYLQSSTQDEMFMSGHPNTPPVKRHWYRTLVIVEDQISCVRISNHLDCVSLGGTNINNPLLLPLMLMYDEIILWLDGDEAGRRASDRFIKKYKLYRDIKVITTLRDPKCFNKKEMQALLNSQSY